jgi:hypothetical protein
MPKRILLLLTALRFYELCFNYSSKDNSFGGLGRGLLKVFGAGSIF